MTERVVETTGGEFPLSLKGQADFEEELDRNYLGIYFGLANARAAWDALSSGQRLALSVMAEETSGGRLIRLPGQQGYYGPLSASRFRPSQRSIGKVAEGVAIGAARTCRGLDHLDRD